MKYLKQFLIIIAISMIGEILKYLLPLPVPASIYGMVILFVGLMTGIIKLESVREAGKFLITCRSGTYVILGSVKTCSYSCEYNNNCVCIHGYGCQRSGDSVPYTIKKTDEGGSL